VPKEDYLLKYLEKLSRVIAAMLGLRDKGFPEDALRLADETYKELLGFDVEELAIMPVEKFVELIHKHGYTSSHLEIMARLAHETANALNTRTDSENSNSFYEKTLQLYYLLNEKDKTFSFEREMIIDELKQLTTKSDN
jgi:hypothetical protein